MAQYNHSMHMKKLWKEGAFDNRDETYRSQSEYKKRVSDSVKKKWEKGAYTEERNSKISKKLKGKNKGKKKTRVYFRKCKNCQKLFSTPRQHKYLCNNAICKSNHYKNRKIDPITEKIRRKKISKTMKGKIPKNLKQNMRSANSPRQIQMFNTIKKYFSCVEFNYFIKTKKTHRFLDVAVLDLKIDFEYNGKVHLMKSVQINDIQREKEIKELGWKMIIIDRNNFSQLEEICKEIKKGNI